MSPFRAENREHKRDKWRQLPCPKCHSKSGERCKGPTGYRASVHQERRCAKSAPSVPIVREQYMVSAPMDHGEYFDQFVKEAAQGEAVRYEEEVYSICRKCESPIEALLIAALHKHGKISGGGFQFCLNDKPAPVPAHDETAFVYTQVCVGEYRADILIHDVSLPLNLREPRWMIVECDGHDYHERTKEQARRDKKRDRFFTAKGFKVLRFAGSEIWADPDACAEEIDYNLVYNDQFRLRDR